MMRYINRLFYLLLLTYLLTYLPCFVKIGQTFLEISR